MMCFLRVAAPVRNVTSAPQSRRFDSVSDGLQRGLPHGPRPEASRQHQFCSLAPRSRDGSGLWNQQGRPGHLPARVSLNVSLRKPGLIKGLCTENHTLLVSLN